MIALLIMDEHSETVRMACQGQAYRLHVSFGDSDSTDRRNAPSAADAARFRGLDIY